ncbi:MAG: replicative DNA helicase [Candidatus Izemoplasmatales bacterium]|jgi:replicative DNA helicase|nr:replicative DNA helicase [Candidatus Izemoplasmatales bacterium]MDD4354962.1 replicative DNA helicase [Candidatus Izemoplasmatales bacterium]MDD4988560.1 replicative DNA helicase [Candidatus Izemoplasmatales bacterium]MDY0373659.1 replicative DNA helicase [Candidatus Izemoplasmatales bacterium]NLF48290.1 replicative DNA helicase [Acholeplasmataceae bacterium]
MERKVPQNIEAEQAVLGAVFFDQATMKTIVDKLQEEDFFSPNHQVIYRIMKTLFQENIPIDYQTLTDRLENHNLLVKSGGIDYITGLIDSVPSVANLINYINIVKDKAILRKIQDSCREIIEDSYTTDNTPEFIDSVEKTIIGITKEKRTTDFKSVGEVANLLVDRIAEQAQIGGAVTGLDTKYHEFNKFTLGLQPSDLIIVAARPSMGKTAFALNLALNVAKSPSRPHIAFFSLEMGVDQLVMRLISCQAQVDNFRMRQGRLNAQEWDKIHYAVSTLSSLNLYFDDSGTVKVTDLRSKCRKLKQDDKLDLVIVDYLQLLSGSQAYSQTNRVQEVSEISRVLKEVARELKVPVVALSQLSRGVELRKDKKPVMADLRESGSIEQDADIILFLYREDAYEQETTKKNHVEMSIAKNRSGTIGDFELLFNKNMSTFSNLLVSADEQYGEKQPLDER